PAQSTPPCWRPPFLPITTRRFVPHWMTTASAKPPPCWPIPTLLASIDPFQTAPWHSTRLRIADFATGQGAALSSSGVNKKLMSSAESAATQYLEQKTHAQNRHYRRRPVRPDAGAFRLPAGAAVHVSGQKRERARRSGGRHHPGRFRRPG